MKYKVLYDTQINGEHKSKDSVIEFPYSTDSNYIQRLVKLKVIELSLVDEEIKDNERLELEEKAKSLGISFNSKTKNETIIRKIQEIETRETKEN